VTRLPGRDSIAYDAVIGAAIAAAGIVAVARLDDPTGPLWLNVLAMVVYGALVVVRRRAPALAGYGFVTLLVVQALVLTPAPELPVMLLGLMLFPYAAGTRMHGRPASAYVPALFGAIVVINLAWGESHLGDFVFPPAVALAAYFAGRNVAHRSALTVELHEAALRAGEEREAQARHAVSAERRRIAREMHDVVAHSISVMVVQAAGARRILEREPERAREAAAQIERTGRETLLEMRRLLGVMRGDGTELELTPSPTVDDLEPLVDRAREAGLDVRLRVDGTPRPLGAGLALGAYRVVQDALDDILRVARTASTEVHVRWTPAALEITIADDRPGVPFAEGAGPALIGVRERVALYGGELRTGQRSAGGHEVHVRFPLDDSAHRNPPANPDTVPAEGAA
jgi:signal transduction histidine kinase